MSASKLFTRIVVTVAALVLLGFSIGYNSGPDKPTTPQQTGLISQQAIDAIKPGMSYDAVIAALGPPHRQVMSGVVILIYKMSDNLDAVIGLSGITTDSKVVSVKEEPSAVTDEIK